jgi:hypothetical protein
MQKLANALVRETPEQLSRPKIAVVADPFQQEVTYQHVAKLVKAWQ